MTETKTSVPASPERVQLSPFERARRELYSIVGEVEDQFEKTGINSEEIPRGTYWLAVADQANRKVNEKYSTVETMEYGQLLRLTAIAPAGFLAQRALGKLNHPSNMSFSPQDQERRRNLVGLASNYIDTMASYARADEHITVNELNDHLCKTLEKTIEYPEAATRATIADHVRGVQQEVSVGYLLANELETRISGMEEDIQGADYIIRVPETSQGVMVDIKSSRYKLAENNPDFYGDWTIKNGRILILSPLDEADLNGKFYPTHEAVAQKSPAVGNIVRAALQKQKQLRKVLF